MNRGWAVVIAAGISGCAVAPTDTEDRVSEQIVSDDAEAAISTCLSHGSGGRFRDRMFQTFVARDGTTAQYHLYAGGAWTATPGLLVYLHGYGAHDFDNPSWNLDGMADVARDHDLITLAVRTPSSDTAWLTDPVHNATVLSELISRVVLDKFPINGRRVLLVGYSNGAAFLSAFYLPLHGEDSCGGGSILFGEGHPPWIGSLANHTYASTFVDHFKLHFYAGQDDPYLQDSIDGASFYARLGFTVTEQHPDGVGHLDIPFSKVLARRLERGFLPAP